MEYYKLLQLDREPFSNSPDPEYFFQSRQHLSCIQKLEVALRLKRGLNVVIGDVGTGKTTICREIIRRFSEDSDVETHLILDPAIQDADEFLGMIHTILCGQAPPPDTSAIDRKEAIKQTLFKKGVEDAKTIILIIDEGQKLLPAGMEILRELLNYETNTHKLLQIAIFAQQEFVNLLEAHPNFADRINLLHHLAPMNFSDTCRMIHHRLKLASSTPRPLNPFTFPAMLAIYHASKGYPRRVIHLCHQSILTMIIQNRTKASWALIRSCKQRLGSSKGRGFHWRSALTATLLVCLVFFGILYAYPRWYGDQHSQMRSFPIPTTDQAPVESKLSQAQPITTKMESTEIEKLNVNRQPEIIDTAIVGTNPLIQPTSLIGSPGIGIDNTSAEPTTIDVANIIKEAELPKPTLQPQSVSPQPPPIIGELVVRRGDTLSRMISLVYGEYREIHLEKILKANPHIADPDTISSGRIILFPAITFEINPLLSQCNWIILESTNDLNTALERSTMIARQAHVPTQLITGWMKENQLNYFITIKGYFATRDKADAFLSLLPDAMVSKAEIVPDWPTKLTLFADPYVGGVR